MCIRPGKIHRATSATKMWRERTEPVNVRHCIQPKQNIDFDRTHTKHEAKRRLTAGTQQHAHFPRKKKMRKKTERHSFVFERNRAPLAVSLCAAMHSFLCDDDLQLLLQLFVFVVFNIVPVRRVVHVFVEMRPCMYVVRDTHSDVFHLALVPFSVHTGRVHILERISCMFRYRRDARRPRYGRVRCSGRRRSTAVPPRALVGSLRFVQSSSCL